MLTRIMPRCVENALSGGRACGAMMAWTQIVSFALIFSDAYIRSAEIWQTSLFLPKHPEEIIVLFRARILLTYVLVHIMPASVLDTPAFRFFFVFLFSIGCFALMKIWVRRLSVDGNVAIMTQASFMLVMLLHYSASRVLNAFYVYDIPSIFFYLLSFLLLTDRRPAIFGLGFAAVFVFAANRETIVVVAFHAAAFILADKKQAADRKERMLRLAALAVAPVGIFLVRVALLHALDGHMADGAGLYSDGTLRFWANVKSLFHEPPKALQLVLLGCGLLIWWPFTVFRMRTIEKYLIAASALPLVLLLLAGNLVELRIYGELIPLMALLLAYFLQGVGKDAGDARAAP